MLAFGHREHHITDQDQDDGLYRIEVEELTDLVRNDASWSNLKEVLRVAGFNPDADLLASYYEDEEDNEYGVLMTTT